MVAIAFIPNPENKPEVNHKYGIKKDNRASELEWATGSENCKHAYEYNLREATKGKANSRSKPINQYDLQGNFIKEWECIHEAERQLKISNSNITQCCKGRRKTTGGYMWRYKD